MNLSQARAYADKIVKWLDPYCERIEVAGSIRRERPICNDVDLVVIPKSEHKTDLLGAIESQRNLLHEFLTGYVADQDGKAHWLAGQEKPDGRNLLLQLPRCQLDIFCATTQTFGSLLLCRTGSKEHNIWLASRATRFCCHWFIYAGLKVGGDAIASHCLIAHSEEAIYEALKLPWIPPQERELSSLRRFN
jgi:DNA polymerase (family 10)